MGSCGVLVLPMALLMRTDSHATRCGFCLFSCLSALVCQLGIKLWWGGDVGHGPGVEAAAVG